MNERRKIRCPYCGTPIPGVWVNKKRDYKLFEGKSGVTCKCSNKYCKKLIAI